MSKRPGHTCNTRKQLNTDVRSFYPAPVRENLNASLITRLGTRLADACMVLREEGEVVQEKKSLEHKRIAIPMNGDICWNKMIENTQDS